MSHRMLSAVRRSGRTSTGTWYVEPPTRRDLTSTAGLQLSTAALKSLRASCFARSSMAPMASYMIFSAVLFLPPYIIMLTNFATIRLRYVPDQHLVELKSLKLYLWSFRDEGHFHEDVTNRILDDLVKTLRPKRMTVVGDFSVRGGIHTVVTASHP